MSENIAVASVKMDISFFQNKPPEIPDGGWIHTVISGVLASTLVEISDALNGNVPWKWDDKKKVTGTIAQMVICCLIEQLCQTCQRLGVDRSTFMKAVEHGWNATKLDLATPDDAGVGHA
jgi:hypothetical protein